MSILPAVVANEDTPPQLIGEFKPVDDWQVHFNALFYGLRGTKVREYSQTLASADYRLAHALAVDFRDHWAKQKTAYEISECDWSSDVCSSDLRKQAARLPLPQPHSCTMSVGGRFFCYVQWSRKSTARACASR